MRLTTTCPNDTTLFQFLCGGLPDEVATRIAFHIGGCIGCAKRAETLRVSDALVGVVRQPPPPLSAVDREQIDSLIAYRPEAEPMASPRPLVPVSPVTVSEAGAETPPDGTDRPKADWGIGHLGTYRLTAILGTGGMGTVYEAIDTQLHRRVAVKVMNASVARNTLARQRFLREARAAASVRTPHIITIYQVGESRETLYLAMEILEGETLQDRCVRQGILPIRDAVRIARETAIGLTVAHGKRLIHRDIKPANLWLEDPHGHVKILDFGLVRPVDAGDLRLTPDGMGVGTPGYVAPEQVQGKAVDGRADLFSLGCVLYRMVTGRPPFHGKTILEVLTALAVDTPPRPSQVNPAVPHELDTLIVQMMMKRPEQRPVSASALVERLTAIERSILSGTAQTPILDLLPAPGRRRNGPIRIAAAAMFGIAATAGVIVALSR